MKKLTVKEGARQLARIRKEYQKLEDEAELDFISVDGLSGIQLSTRGFLQLQKDSCAEVKFNGRGSSGEYPLEAELTFDKTKFFTVLSSEEVKKFKEMGFEVKV